MQLCLRLSSRPWRKMRIALPGVRPRLESWPCLQDRSRTHPCHDSAQKTLPQSVRETPPVPMAERHSLTVAETPRGPPPQSAMPPGAKHKEVFKCFASCGSSVCVRLPADPTCLPGRNSRPRSSVGTVDRFQARAQLAREDHTASYAGCSRKLLPRGQQFRGDRTSLHSRAATLPRSQKIFEPVARLAVFILAIADVALFLARFQSSAA
jgi:hypothetical protein